MVGQAPSGGTSYRHNQAANTLGSLGITRHTPMGGLAVLGAISLGIFTLLVSALNTAAISGGLLLAPLAAGLLVKAVRIFNRPHQPPAPLSGH